MIECLDKMGCPILYVSLEVSLVASDRGDNLRRHFCSILRNASCVVGLEDDSFRALLVGSWFHDRNIDPEWNSENTTSVRKD